MFEYKHFVKLADTDSAGVLFFANQFRIIHYAFETFLHDNGISVRNMLYNDNCSLPLTHAEADFNLPIHVSDELVIRISVNEYSKTSFTLLYTINNKFGLCGTAKTVHFAMDLNNGNKTNLPDYIFELLHKYYSNE